LRIHIELHIFYENCTQGTLKTFKKEIVYILYPEIVNINII